MAIETSWVPGLYVGTLRPEFRVEGDSPFCAYPTKGEALEREAELAAADHTVNVRHRDVVQR